MKVTFEDRFFDFSIDDINKEKLTLFIEANFTGNYKDICKNLEEHINDFPGLSIFIVEVANRYRLYSQIIDKISVSTIKSCEMIEGVLSNEKDIGITIGVTVAEPDDFIGVLSIYF